MIKILYGSGVSGFMGTNNVEKAIISQCSMFFDSGEFLIILPWVEGTNVDPLVLVIF